ncbi:MAG: PQQ-dependent sugar dehydrogenase, partial [Gammaproteobacteria bacterium]
MLQINFDPSIGVYSQRWFGRFWCWLVLVIPTAVLGQNADIFESQHHNFRLVTVAKGLSHPWSMAFLGDGDLLVTERPGRLRIIRDGNLLAEPVKGIPDVRVGGQGGLQEVLPHPNFESNRLLYLSYAKAN